MLCNSGIDHSERVSVLAAVSPSDVNLTESSTTDSFLAVVSYEQVASVVKHCDRGQSLCTANVIEPLQDHLAMVVEMIFNFILIHMDVNQDIGNLLSLL